MRGGYGPQKGKLHSEREVGKKMSKSPAKRTNANGSGMAAQSSSQERRPTRKVIEAKEPMSSSSQATTSSEMANRKKEE